MSTNPTTDAGNIAGTPLTESAKAAARIIVDYLAHTPSSQLSDDSIESHLPALERIISNSVDGFESNEIRELKAELTEASYLLTTLEPHAVDLEQRLAESEAKAKDYLAQLTQSREATAQSERENQRLKEQFEKARQWNALMELELSNLRSIKQEEKL